MNPIDYQAQASPDAQNDFKSDESDDYSPNITNMANASQLNMTTNDNNQALYNYENKLSTKMPDEYPTPPNDHTSPANDETASNTNHYQTNPNFFPNYNDYVNEFNRYFYANNLANLTPYGAFQQNFAYYGHMNQNQFSFYDNQNFMPKSNNNNNESFHTLPVALEQHQQVQIQPEAQSQPQLQPLLSYSMDRIIEQEQKPALLLNKEESEPSSPQNESASDAKDEPEQKVSVAKSEIKPRSKNSHEAKQNNAYLMQPPDSESIAAAAATASINRSKRRTRTKFDKHQIDVLEATFQRAQYPDVNIVDRLGTILNLTTERISVWFQNRRARYKRTKKDTTTTLSKQQIEQNNLFLNEVLKGGELDRSGDTNPNESTSNASSRASTPATLPNETNMYLNYYQQAAYNPANPLFKPNMQPYVN